MSLSYNAFKVICIVVAIVLVLGMGYCTKQVFFSGSTTAGSQPPYQAPQSPPQKQSPPVQPQVRTPANPDQVRAAVEQWLSYNSDRKGKNKLVDVIPNQSFKVTAIRFPDADAAKFSDNPSQWSQIKIDLTRDGIDDEKWLLKNGRLYKREIMDGNGKTTQTTYF